MSENQDLDLSAIPGLGPVRRAALAEAGINDLRSLLVMKVAELAAIRGIGLWQARKIREFLRQRGLLLDGDEEEGPIVITAPRTLEEAGAVQDVVNVMEAQAEEEARAEAEVALLTAAVEAAEAAVEGAVAESDAEEEAEAVDEEEEPLPEAGEEPEAEEFSVEAAEVSLNGQELLDSVPSEGEEDEAEAASEAAEDEEEESEDPHAQQVREQRDRLPDTALALMEAIRQSAVARQLTRQLTRLLITAGEFSSDRRQFSPQQTRQAAKALKEVEQSLQRAMERREFGKGEQKALADRIRKRRKALEAVLEGE